MEPKQTLTADLRGHFLRLYQMAITDGDFSTSEWKMLYEFAEIRGIEKHELDKLFLTHTGSVAIPEKVETRLEYLYDLCRLIWADGIVTDDERTTLHKFCRKFEFEDENVTELCEYLLDAAEKKRPFHELLAELN
ncbi:MAG: hypothetical protein WBG42_01980 [Cryomorphaceae bacterium]